MAGQSNGPSRSLSQIVWAWLMEPLVLRLEQSMAQGFADLAAQVRAIGGEGGEITQAKNAILAAVAGLQTTVNTLQTNLTAAQQAVVEVQQQLTDAGVTAGTQAETLQNVKSEFDAAEQQLNDAAAALQNPPPTP